MTTPSEILRNVIQTQLRDINTAIPASIVSYDYRLKQCSAQPLLNVRLGNGESVELPIITNVPVIFPSSSNFSMHYPLNEGDEVLLIFSQRSIDEWLSQGGQVTPRDPRMLDISDAIAISGLSNFSSISDVQDNTNFVIKMGEATIKMNPQGRFCFSGVNEELMGILDELFTAIQAITVAADQSGVPVPFIPINNANTFSNLQDRFETLKGDCS